MRSHRDYAWLQREALTVLAAVGVDEPLAGLSAGEVEQVGQLLRELRALGLPSARAR